MMTRQTGMRQLLELPLLPPCLVAFPDHSPPSTILIASSFFPAPLPASLIFWLHYPTPICRLKPDATRVEQWTTAHADIDKEFTSPENNYVLHDSKGFEARPLMMWIDSSDNGASRTAPQRSTVRFVVRILLKATLAELIDIRLCTETPKAGRRILRQETRTYFV